MKSYLILIAVSLFSAVCGHAAGRSGNPILVLATENGYGNYTGELLKTEGFNEFTIQPLAASTLDLQYLKKFDVVILTEGGVSDRQKKILAGFVQQGGNLIAFRPDKKLSKIFGIRNAGDAIDGGYISVNTATAIARGIAPVTLQFHGQMDMYRLSRGKKIATVYKDPLTATGFPAIVTNDFGNGHAMAFLYNLPLSIVCTRQGNRKDAGKEMDGITGIRAMDLFTNGWVDTSKNTINQADEQMRLLSHGIENMNGYSKPLPRLWYFPDGLKSLVTLNNDGEDNKQTEFQKQFEDVDAKGSKMTLYVKELDFISKEWIHGWMDKGFEMSGHPDDTRQAVNPDWQTMDTVFQRLNAKLKAVYGIDPMKTVTNHWFVWCGKNESGMADFSAQAKIEEKNGILLDCNYAHYDNGSKQGHFLGAFGTNQGNYTGSGLPMKFSNTKGEPINVYQHFNNVYDQQYMEHDDKEGFYNCFKGLLDRSIDNGVYSFVSVKAHNAEYGFSERPLMKMLDYADSRNIPVWTEIKLLDFLRARDEASFTDINWAGNKLSFTIKSSLAHTNKISVLVPYIYKGKKVDAITGNGVNQAYSTVVIKGYEYALVSIQLGTDYKITAGYAAGNKGKAFH